MHTSPRMEVPLVAVNDSHHCTALSSHALEAGNGSTARHRRGARCSGLTRWAIQLSLVSDTFGALALRVTAKSLTRGVSQSTSNCEGSRRVPSKLKRCSLLQVNLCQKLLFLHQLTHNMETDFSLNYKSIHENSKLKPQYSQQ